MGNTNNAQLSERHDQALIGQLTYIFITTKKHRIEDVASRLHMSYNDLYNYITGRRTMPATLLVELSVVTKDLIFLDTITTGTSIKIEWRTGVHEHTEDIVEETFQIGEAAGEVFKTMKKALRDKRLTDEEKNRLITQLDNLANEVHDVKKLLVSASAKIINAR